MADRSQAAVGGDNNEALFTRLSLAIEALAGRLRRVETWSNQIAPAGMRFEREEVEGEGAYLVVVEVATGNRGRIAGPL